MSLISPADLKSQLANPSTSRESALLLVLGSVHPAPARTAALKSLAFDAGLRKAKRWNVSDILAKARGLVLNAKAGWELTAAGQAKVAGLLGTVAAVASTRASLVNHVAGLADADSRAFLQEAIACFDAKLYRAAVVFTWVGAVAVMHRFVANNHLAAFDAAGQQRYAKKWPGVTSVNDLGRITEAEFLEVAYVAKVLHKNQKQLLEEALRKRNSAGHPTPVKISENVAAAYIEELVLNVFEKF